MNPDPSLSESGWDSRLTAAFSAAPVPPTPAGLALRVRRRLRRRRLLQRAGITLSAAALLTAGVLAWAYRPQTDPVPAPEVAAYDISEPTFLRSAPPVDTLDLLARQQAAYLAVLDQMEKEF